VARPLSECVTAWGGRAYARPWIDRALWLFWEDLSAEARKYAGLALATIVQICAEAKMDRDRLAAARELLDRGFGRAVQAIDLVMMGRKLTELSRDELVALDALFASADAAATEQPPAEEAVH
jgi:hypothetical protein